MVTLQVKRTVKLPLDKSILLHAAQLTLELQKITIETDISLVIADDTLLKRLNRLYRSTDETTDVLSFPSGEQDPDTARLYLGDVVISLPRAQAQAAAGKHSLADELSLLVVHGTLHLLGYDHMEPGEKKKMQTAQGQVLDALGCTLNYSL